MFLALLLSFFFVPGLHKQYWNWYLNLKLFYHERHEKGRKNGCL
ncbi:hypothetical protein BMETH_542_1 [methanotrophic bacterial endosymbiont of Bathymodiolus sp.]|nr:hypothetical protein BMETH_542_1 [methanotrophic bacterial endosymbiont of Bathymodiolus sp.]